MQITKHGDPTKIKQYNKVGPIHFTCDICGCEWNAYFGERGVTVSTPLRSWQSPCPENGCNGFGFVNMLAKYKED